jgi:cellulose synthase/poly-beta-1,6-N-acetylglucosamine synthase-like glycosyltransferase
MSPVLVLLSITVTVLLFAIALTTLVWMLDAWRTPDSFEQTKFIEPPAFDLFDEARYRRKRRHRRSRRLSFSLIVPARHEEAVLARTLDQLASIHHPRFEVVAVVGHDDPGTTAVAEAAAQRHDCIKVVVDHKEPKNKPKALNSALPACTGDIVGVFDAEDEVSPDLLSRVETTFRQEQADVVQGGVQLMNFDSSWWALRNVLEYFFYFRSRLHAHARWNFIPLGGNTVFVRRRLLVEHGGWDETCLAEDCELGVRLSTAGAKVAVAYDAELATREETPASIVELVKQRTRWNQGFLQVLRKGVWRDLPTRRQRALARFTLAFPFLQAATFILVPLSLAMVLILDAPVLLALFSFLPLVVILVSVAAEAAGLAEFTRIYGLKAKPRHYFMLAVGTMPYHVLLSVSAARAVVRNFRRENGWEKTTHVGAHRPAAAEAAA